MGEIEISRHRVEGQTPRGLTIWFGVVAGALLLACCAFAGSALAGGPHPDPPPKAPPPPPPASNPPPPPAAVAPPPPPAYVAPPPPPAPVVRAKVRRHVKADVAKQPKPAPRPGRTTAKPLLAAAGPVAAAETSAGTLSPALLIVAFGVVFALLATGVSFMPASAVPFALGLRLERSRQTILLFGLAIGVACALVGLFTAVAGR